MTTVDFYKLPRSIQDRFVGSVMSGFPPAPLVAAKGRRSTRGLWLAVSAVAFVLLVVLARLGYGSLDSALAIQATGMLPIYLGLVFALVFGLVQSWSRVVRERAHPYADGVYLFPACLIDARTDRFEVFDVRELSSIDAAGNVVRVAFGAKAFAFPTASAAEATEIVARFQATRESTLQAIASEDPKELVNVDPLHNPRFSSPVGPREPYEVRRPLWRSFGWAAALVLAVLAAPLLWKLRNGGSDRTMYARATKANDVASYGAYLQRGVAYHDQVADLDLPRAELRDAVRSGKVDELVAYRDAHPQSHIQGEIAAEIHTAMLSELEKAKARGTLAALDAFAKTFPDHGVDAELRQAKHAVYTRALAAYEQRAPNKNKAVVPYVRELFAWSEKHGPAVEVRFRRKKSESLGRADKFVGQTPTFAGEVSYPSRYFDDKGLAPREQALGTDLAQRLDDGLSPELFDVKVGERIGPDAEGLPEVRVPTLFITYAVEWSGHGYTANKPRGSYVGLIFPFEALLVVPGEAKPFRVKIDVFRPAALNVLKEAEEPPAVGQAEEMVYRAMAREAFDQYEKKLLVNFFADGDK